MNASTATDNSPAPLGQDARIIGLVGVAHGISHFSQLSLAPLFPLIKAEFGYSYAELGLLMSIFFVVSGVGQALAGFVVDRIGARPVLFGGIALLGVSVLGLATASNYAAFALFSLVGGIGNAVFHPADYTLLNQRVSPARLGHAFSSHGIAGNLGWALAPVFLTALAVPFGWRGALIGAAVLIFAVLALLATQRQHLTTRTEHAQPGRSTGDDDTFGFLRLPMVWMCFAFFLISAMAMTGIQSFTPSALQAIYALPIWQATAGVTVYMLASALGAVWGGFLAGATKRHERIIAPAFCGSGLLALVVASGWPPAWLILPLLAGIGFGAGVAGPSRDLLVRGASPKNATGRVYGVVYSGLDTGCALGPLLFGAIMDGGHPHWVFIAVGIFQVLAVLTAVGVGNRPQRSAATTTAAAS